MRRRNPSFKVTDAVVVTGIGLGIYTLYKLLQKVPDVTKKAAAPVATVIASGINLWNRLVTSPPMGGVLGNMIFPDGTVIGPLAGAQIKTDSSGNVYTLIGGDVYQIGQSDSNGDWPLQLVLAPNFGVTGTTW